MHTRSGCAVGQNGAAILASGMAHCRRMIGGAMAMHRNASEIARSIAQLRTEHAELDARLADLRARAETDDWRYLDEVWDDLVDDLESHFVYEEEVILPELRRTRADGPDLATKLCTQHEALRSDLGLIGVQIQLHAVRLSTIDGLLTRLREHAALESRVLYPWASEQTALAAHHAQSAR